MATNLDKINFGRNDPKNMIDQIENFPESCFKAFRESADLVLPSYYIKANKFVILGMGGSGISGDVVKDLLSEGSLMVESAHDYKIPNWVDKETVVIACSYSGNTEEALSGFVEAQKKGAKLIAITTGGKLKVLADKFNVPLFQFNLQTEPRAAFAYLFTFLLSVFVKLEHFNLTEKEFGQTIDCVGQYRDKFKSNVKTDSNPAKILAKKIFGKTPVVYSGGSLVSVGRRLKTQFNENAKNFAFCEFLPELDHNAIVGLNHPKNNHFIVFLESNYDESKTIKRQNITAQILQKNKIAFEQIKFLPCESLLAEILTMINFGDFVSYYLGILNDENIDQNENIDFLKNELAK